MSFKVVFLDSYVYKAKSVGFILQKACVRVYGTECSFLLFRYHIWLFNTQDWLERTERSPRARKYPLPLMIWFVCVYPPDCICKETIFLSYRISSGKPVFGAKFAATSCTEFLLKLIVHHALGHSPATTLNITVSGTTCVYKAVCVYRCLQDWGRSCLPS